MKTSSIISALVVGTIALAQTPPPVPTPPSAARPGLAAVVAPQTVSIQLSWPYDGLSDDISFKVYTTDSLTAPVTWTLLMVVPSSPVTLQVVPGRHFYQVTTFSTFWTIETPPSPVVSTPAAPAAVTPSVRKL